MTAEEYGVPCGFDSLFSKNVPHILEKIFFSVDYQSYKNCFEVNKIWHDLLTSESYQRKGRSVFHDALLEDEKKLHSASGEGNAHEVGRLLYTGMLDVNCVWQYNKTTPLSEAAKNSHYEVVQRLLNSSADPNKADIDEETPLYFAAKRGRKDIAQLLLDSGTDPNKANIYGDTPLHMAARDSHFEVVQLLLKCGADRNQVSRDGMTPLHLAEASGHTYTIQLLRQCHRPK